MSLLIVTLRLTAALGLSLGLGLGAACGPKPIVVLKTPDGDTVEAPPPATEEEEKAAAAVAAQVQALEDQGDAAGAEAQRTVLAEQYPGTAQGAAVLEARARAAAAAGQAPAAVALLERLLLHRPSYRSAGPELEVRELYASLLQQVGRAGDAAEVLRPSFDESTDVARRLRLGGALVSALQNAGQVRQALEILVELRNTAGLSAEQRAEAENRARNLAGNKLSLGEAAGLWDEVGGDSGWDFLHPLLAFRLAKIHYHTRDYDQARTMLGVVVDRFPSSPYGKLAKDLLRRLDNRFTVSPKRVGVLLPLSGRFQEYGNRSLAAIKLALAGSAVELVVKDSADDPALTSQAVDQLVLDEHVIAMIGPQFSKEGLAAALKAEELSVPLLALSHREGLPQVGPWVFRTALTVRAQAKALAALAFEKLGWSRFALLYPRNNYGVEFIEAFWDEVDARKGEIRAVEGYENDQTTFSSEVRSMVGRWHYHARGEYNAKVGDLRARGYSGHRLSQAVEEYAKGLPPVVDFDAIVIPDAGRKVGLIAPALAFEDVVMTHDEKVLKTIAKATGNPKLHPVTLIGGSTWNSPQTLESCERYCEEAIFVDGYFVDSPDPKVRDFVSRFREATGAEPQLSDAQAYDTATMLRGILETHKPADRKALLKYLGEVSGFKGVTGPMRFDADGDAVKELYRLTIRDQTIKLWEPPQPPPQG